MSQVIESFFDGLAQTWDERADDDLTRVEALLRRAGIGVGMNVLDVACGTGVITGLLHDLTKRPVHALDLSGKMIEQAKRKYGDCPDASFEVADFLAYSSEGYEAIVIYNAFPHFLDVAKLRDALDKNLLPGGRFVIVHSLGREKLKHHHQGLGSAISRSIRSPQEEMKSFISTFETAVLDEGPDFYLMVGIKK